MDRSQDECNRGVWCHADNECRSIVIVAVRSSSRSVRRYIPLCSRSSSLFGLFFLLHSLELGMHCGVLKLSLAIWTNYFLPGIEHCLYNARINLALVAPLRRISLPPYPVVFGAGACTAASVPGLPNNILFPHATKRLSHRLSPHIESSHFNMICVVA